MSLVGASPWLSSSNFSALWPFYKTHSLIPDCKPHWSWFPDVGVSDRELITVEHKAHYFKDIGREDFLLEILDKVRNKASCNELQSVWDWEWKKEMPRKAEELLCWEIWYLTCKLITFRTPARLFFFFHLCRNFFFLYSLLFDPTPSHTVGTFPKYFGRGRFPEAF